MSHESHCWKIVEDFVTHFNEYCTHLFSPSDLICANESISQWYGQGVHWINLGLPMYVVMDRKPENGAEIQNSACGWLGIMMRLNIVKSAKNDEEHQYDRDNLPHGTKVLKKLVMPWDNTDRIVCADSYFASVSAAEELWKHGLRSIGFIKTETRQFSMVYLSNIEFQKRGDMSGLLTRPVDRTKPVLGAFVWMDRNRRYFICTGGSMEKGRTYTRTRWRQEEPAPNADPNMVELTIPQSITVEIYYSACGQIDRHNRCRQEILDIKKSWVLNIGRSGSIYLFL